MVKYNQRIDDGGHQRIVVLGLGRSGCAAVRLAAEQGYAVAGLDEAENVAVEQLREETAGKDVELYTGWRGERLTFIPDLAVISPGIPPSSHLSKLVETLKCPVISELEFGYRHCSCPIIAITGTNGKTTTVNMVAHILKGAGWRVETAGNLEVALSDAARRSAELDVIAVEVSSFQLERCERFRPEAAAVLNVSVDHMERYTGFAEYAATKARLLRNISPGERVVVRSDVCTLPAFERELARLSGGEPILFAGELGPQATYGLDDTGWLCRQDDQNKWARLGHADDLPVKGRHNMENVMAAIALCSHYITPEQGFALLQDFVPCGHRLAFVESVAGVTYIDDSKATNPDATIRAVETVRSQFQGRIFLIAGGLDKQLSFNDVALVLGEKVKKVYLIGEAKDRLKKVCSVYVDCVTAGSMTEAVKLAAQEAQAGDVVLLSPACASQDMFKDYAHRGREFERCVKRSVY